MLPLEEMDKSLYSESESEGERISQKGQQKTVQKPLNKSSLPNHVHSNQLPAKCLEVSFPFANQVDKFQMTLSSLFLIFCLALAISITLTSGEQLLLANKCKESVWPGILGNSGHLTPNDGGFHLGSGEHVVIEVPKKWSGRIWGRQGCSFGHDGKGSCDTGDCSGKLHCRGTSGVPPATMVEVTLGSSLSPLHYYDVSLVDGFNMPLSMKPIGGGIGCGVASCDIDVNIFCPSALEVKKNGKVVGCKSACLAMQSAKYCCTGKYADPKTCKPTLFAHLFKAMCPKAYTYAFDDASSLHKCKVSRYAITFIGLVDPLNMPL